MRAAVVEPNRLCIRQKLRVEVLRTHHIQNRRAQVRVADDSEAFDLATIDHDSLHSRRPDQNLRDIATYSGIDPVLSQFRLHLAHEIICAPLVDENAFGHEVGKDDAISNRRILERRPVGIRNRLHQQSDDIFATREELFKQLSRCHGLIIVEIHPTSSVEELSNALSLHSKLRGEQLRKILPIECRGEREHRIVEPDVVQLNDI